MPILNCSERVCILTLEKNHPFFNYNYVSIEHGLRAVSLNSFQYATNENQNPSIKQQRINTSNKRKTYRKNNV